MLKRMYVHRATAGCVLLLVVALVACGDGPDEDRVRQNFGQIFAKEAGAGVKPIIASVGPGEGDSDNAYEHIRFDVLALEDVAPNSGWFAGTTLRKGQRLFDGEVVVLYQKKKGSEWVNATYTLTRAPKSSP